MALSDSLAETIRESVLRVLMNFHTAMPGNVFSYNATKQTAEIRPSLKILGNLPRSLKTLVTLPVLPNVPVVWPGGGGLGVHAPLSAGDTVLLIFCERSLDIWRQSAGSKPVDPGDHRANSLTGAVAIPLLRRHSVAMGTLATGSTLNLGADNGVLDFVALSAKVDLAIANIRTILNAHVHSGVTAGAASTGPLVTPLGAQASSAASSVKAT